MRKPQGLPLKIFSVQLMELNNYLTLFPGSSSSKKMDPEELNEILLQAVLKLWARRAYLQVWDLNGKTYNDTRDMFELMEITEEIYKRGAPSKNNQQSEADHASFGRNKKGRGSALTSNPKKDRTGKIKINDAGHPSNAPTVAKKTCMLHCPGHSSEW